MEYKEELKTLDLRKVQIERIKKYKNTLENWDKYNILYKMYFTSIIRKDIENIEFMKNFYEEYYDKTIIDCYENVEVSADIMNGWRQLHYKIMNVPKKNKMTEILEDLILNEESKKSETIDEENILSFVCTNKKMSDISLINEIVKSKKSYIQSKFHNESDNDLEKLLLSLFSYLDKVYTIGNTMPIPLGANKGGRDSLDSFYIHKLGDIMEASNVGSESLTGNNGVEAWRKLIKECCNKKKLNCEELGGKAIFESIIDLYKIQDYYKILTQESKMKDSSDYKKVCESKYKEPRSEIYEGLFTQNSYLNKRYFKLSPEWSIGDYILYMDVTKELILNRAGYLLENCTEEKVKEFLDNNKVANEPCKKQS